MSFDEVDPDPDIPGWLGLDVLNPGSRSRSRSGSSSRSISRSGSSSRSRPRSRSRHPEVVTAACLARGLGAEPARMPVMVRLLLAAGHPVLLGCRPVAPLHARVFTACPTDG